MLNSSLSSILYICADLSSFSRASEVLYTTQPNVSKVIRSLEEKLGFEVFERDNRGIKLTRRGRQAYEYAGKILEQERQLAQIYKIDDREEFSILITAVFFNYLVHINISSKKIYPELLITGKFQVSILLKSV